MFACAQAKRAPFNAFGSNDGAEKKKDEVGRGGAEDKLAQERLFELKQ